MEQFVYGLLAGIALGMWISILLYQFLGKRRHGWPLRRRKDGDAQPSQRAKDGNGPADDYTEDYYERLARRSAQAPQQPVPPVAQAPAQPAAPVQAEAAEHVLEADEDEDYADEDGEDADLEEGAEEASLDPYERLLARMHGDVKATERLIEQERARTPAAPRTSLIQNALDRLEYGAR